MNTPYLPLLEALCNAPGLSGFEDSVVEIVRTHCQSFATVEENAIRNLYLNPHPTGDVPVVMLDAHSDEVGFVIQSIHPNGTLGFIPVGGMDASRHEGAQVVVCNAQGDYIPGVLSARPPHFRKEGGTTGLTIDIGATCAQEVADLFQVEVGAPCVPRGDFVYSPKQDVMLGKAMDCRVGCAAMIAVMERLQGASLGVSVVGCLSSQEEVGARGAKVAVQSIQPQLAIVFEGAPADDTVVPGYQAQCALGKGPMIRLVDVSMITNPRFVRYAKAVAKEHNIPVQWAVRSGGGTDAGCIHLHGNSVPTLVVSVPVRYIHAPNALATYRDFAHTVDLVVALIQGLNGEVIGGF